MKTRPLSSRAVCAIVGIALLVESALAVAQPAVQHAAPQPHLAPPSASAPTKAPTRTYPAPATPPTWEVAAETYAFVFGLGLVGYGLFFRRQVKQRY